MYTDYTPPFLLIRKDGYVMEFNDLVSLTVAVREAKIMISDYHVRHITFYYNHVVETDGEWIVRDDRGKMVSERDRLDAVPYRCSGRWKDTRDLKRHAEALGLPIPNTGKTHRYCAYRHPQGMSVYRERAGIVVDERLDDVRINGKVHLPPNAWDDIIRGSLYDRNWKRFRKTRWKTPCTK